MPEPDPGQLADLVSELGEGLRERATGSPVKPLGAGAETLRSVIPRLSEAAADLRTLRADSFRSLSAERRTDVEQMAQVIVSLVTLLRSPNDLTRLGMLVERAATVIRLLDSLLSYFPTPGGPGTVPLIKVRCPIPGCTQSGYKRSHDQPAPTCPIHNRPMT